MAPWSVTFRRRVSALKTEPNSRAASRSTPPNLTTLPPISGGIALLSAKRNKPAQSNNWASNFVSTQPTDLADLDLEPPNPTAAPAIETRTERLQDSPV